MRVLLTFERSSPTVSFFPTLFFSLFPRVFKEHFRFRFHADDDVGDSVIFVDDDDDDVDDDDDDEIERFRGTSPQRN